MAKWANYKAHWKSRVQAGSLYKDFFSGLASCAKAYIGFCVVIVFCQRLLLYAPEDHLIISADQAGMQDIVYQTADGVSIRSWFKEAAPDMPTIVMFHGNGGNISHRYFKTKDLALEGYGLLLAEYRGYGGNSGKPSETGFYADGRAAIKWLSKVKGISHRDIVIYGESLGTGVAVQMAIEFANVGGLILEAPFTSTIDVVRKNMPWLWPVSFLMLDTYESYLKIPDARMPLLVIHGQADRTIPVEIGKVLFEMSGAKNKNMVIFPEADHNNLATFGMIQEITTFIKIL